jgi:hypothetical protein
VASVQSPQGFAAEKGFLLVKQSPCHSTFQLALCCHDLALTFLSLTQHLYNC